MSLLPVNQPVTRNPSSKLDVWIYGEPQSGKTTFASTFPNAIIITTDGNVKHITTPAIRLQSFMTMDLAGTAVSISGWEYLTTKILPELQQNTSYQTVILDLVEDMYELCRAHWNRKNNVNHESEVEWSRGYNMIREDFYNFIKDIKALPKHMVLISHTKDNTGAKGNIEVRPNITQKVRNKLEGYVDLVSHLYKYQADDGLIYSALTLSQVEPVSNNRWGISQPAAIRATYDSLVQTLNTPQGE